MRKTIGIIGTEQVLEGNTSQRVAFIYPKVVAALLEATPLVIPAMPETQDIGHLTEIFDGIVLTGARPNVHPEEWGDEPTVAHEPYDRGRDRVALPLVRACVDAGLPLFGVCRGMQEMAVAYGSRLHPEIRELPGRMNHRRPQGDVQREEIFRPRHKVHLTPGGVFAGLYGAIEIDTNTLHGQGVEAAGERIIVEGRAEDTTVEAIAVANAPGFALGVQWHAEFDPWDQPVNAVLWRAFRAAVGGPGVEVGGEIAATLAGASLRHRRLRASATVREDPDERA